MIRIENVVKDYGTLRAVDHLNFQINDGEILGFLGPNGAGKSTTLKMITCFLEPTEGNIYVDNYNVLEHSIEVRKMIGYLPEQNPLYEEMIVYDYLKFIANIRGISEKSFKKRLEEVIDKTGLHGVISKPIHTLSKGYRQRTGLAQAILHDPKILILDEPTNGLDPNQIIEIRELIKELGKEKTLIISSHILQEVQAVCERIVIINKGKLVADGSKEELQSGIENKTRLHLELVASENDIAIIPQKIPEVSIVSIENKKGYVKTILEYPKDNDLRPQIFDFIKSTPWTLLEMHRVTFSLEDVFRNLTSENGGNK